MLTFPFNCLRHSVLLAAIVLFISSVFNVSAQRSDAPLDIGVVKPGERTVYQIAIPSFRPRKASDEDASFKQLKAGTFRDVIYNDLELSGVFSRVPNQDYIEEQHELDLKAGDINFPEWKRLKTNFVVKANYALTEDELEAAVELYEIDKQVRVFGKRYVKYKPGQWRHLAHRISDDIHFHITNVSGVALTRLVFVHGNNPKANRIKEIYVMDADGANQTQITDDRSLAATPTWGYKGTEIYYTSYKDFNPDLCRAVVSRPGASWFISRQPGFNLSPSWNEQTQRIALTLGKDGNSEIYTMNREGKNLKRLTYGRAIDSSPSWFPNGRQILFTSDRSGSPQIYVMDSDGINQRRLTYQGTYNDSGVISPRGDRIAITARSRGYFNIYLIDLDGRNWVQLTGVSENQGNNEDPTWAPNGRLLAFTSDRTGSPQIYVINADGSNQRRLTKNGVNHSPDWSPYLYK